MKNPNMKGSTRALSPEQERELIADYEDWFSINELSVRYKISKKTVWRTLRLYRVPRREDKRTRAPAVKSPKPLKPCGSDAAYHRHKAKGEYPCDKCLAAHAHKVKMLKRKKNRQKYGRSTKRKLQPCGTEAAYRRHERNGEEPCQACKDGREKRKAKRKQKRLLPCGTDAAYERHRQNGEETCQPCRDAHNKRNRNR